jgi:ketosteroid isomerase-like protein
MKHVLLILFFATGFSNVFSQKQSDTAAIKNILAFQQNAWNRGDIATFMQGYWKSDSLTFTGAKGITYGWQATYDGYLKRYDSPAKMGQLTFTILEMKTLGHDYYELIGKWHLTRSIGDVGGHFTLLFKRFADGWKIIADHTS